MLRVARAALPFLLLSLFFIPAANADELLDVQKNIDKTNQEYDDTEKSIADIKNQLAALSSQSYSTQEELDSANKEVEAVRQELEKVEAQLDQKKDELLVAIGIRDYQIRYLYKHPGNNFLELFVNAGGFSEFSQMTGYQKKIVGTSKDLIALIDEEVAVVQKNRDEIDVLKEELEKIAGDVSAKLANIQGQISYQAYQENVLSSTALALKSSLSSLTSKQKKLIAQKLAKSAQRQSVGDSPPTSEPLPNPGFSPAYVFLTYGYPHRVGMNQYGAYGRALAGQSYLTILKAYYKNVSVGSYPVPSKISVAGVGNISFEDKYMRGISEMPRSWSMEALKAQAVAARTYALNWLQSRPGQSICTTEACQVYRSSSANCSGTYNQRWCDAVNATRGIVVTYAGSPITAWYASTAGGYTLSSAAVWGGYKAYAQGRKDFGPKGAYDGPKYGNSPWYHTFWNGKGCTGAFPWLTKSEVTDLFNAALLSQKSSSYNQYLSQNPSCYDPENPGWSASTVRSKLNSLGVKDVGSLSNVIPAFDGKGNTSSITFVSNKYPTGKTFSGNFFRSIFNLRSLGNLVILTSLYDIQIR